METNVNPSERLKGKNLIVFDGECVLCSAFFSFVVKKDKQKQFHFSIAQSEFGEALYEYYGLKPEDYDTNLVFINGKLYERLHGFFASMKLLGWPYRVVNIFQFLPNAFLDWAYYKIARNRYKLFGRRETCMVPSQALKDRFINE